ncbi:retroviral-like aspartic protease family protein [Pseudoalteromonas rhizosphaerae]|uniref:retroviral-like aspartic protease family protein n=1 Tax=Pseudoalteromonas rhizosphaerae TaxID=2518973 RepID=UPI0012314C4B|nr:retroviral-like aspartic protease family protein [Pseudoalteromonas rhizosphaerae]
MKGTAVTKFITLLLLLSVALNGYLLWPQQQATAPQAAVKLSPSVIVENNQQSLYQQALQQFNQRQFTAALASYQALTTSQPLQAEQLYFLWLDKLDNWLKNNELTVAETFLQLFLNSYPYDINMLQLDAERLVKNQQLHQAIVALLSLQSLANESQQAAINMRLIQLTMAQIKTLTEQHAWQKTINQTLVWLDYDNENPNYLFALANAYYHLGDLLSAQATLERFPLEHPLQAKVAELQTRIAQAQSGIDLVPLRPYGAHYLLDMQINDALNTQLMIDTGASFTVLPNNVFQALRPIPDYIDSLSINTANGQVIAKRYQLDSILIGQQYIENFEVLVIDNHSGYGLLGMNFLQLFKFNINQQTNQLELAK